MEKHGNKKTMIRHSLFVMYLLCGILFSNSASADNGTASQTVTIAFTNATLNEVIWEFQKQTDFTFIYNTSDVMQVVVHNVKASNENMIRILDQCLEHSDLTYTIHNGVVAIKKQDTAKNKAVPQQQKSVSGRVTDESGQAMPGVNVLVVDTSSGAITDTDGHFQIELSSDRQVTLRFSFIGFTSHEVKASPGKLIHVVMKDDMEMLEEVVVTGYGTFKKSAFAGSASTIKMQEKEDVPAVDFKSLLHGSAPGVQVNSTSGALGGSSQITIRGMGSINASTSPLFVIDGVPVMTSINSSISGGTDIMSTLNTSDIENITMIKDAAAASLYGSRAANGVIIITTKSGKEGRPVFNLKSDWGYSDYATDYREVMGGQERRDIFWEGLYNKAFYGNGQSEAEATAFADDNIDRIRK